MNHIANGPGVPPTPTSGGADETTRDGTSRDAGASTRVQTAIAADPTPHLEALFHASPTGISVTVNRVFRVVNDRLCELTGYRRDELLGQPTRLLHPSDAANDAVAAALYPQLARDGVARIDAQLRRKDGQIIDVALCLAPLYPNDPEQGVIATVLDVTGYRRAQSLLQTRVDLSEEVARGDRDAFFRIALGQALAATRSTTALLRLFGTGDETPRLEVLAAVGRDGAVQVSLLVEGAASEHDPAFDNRPLARCRRCSDAALLGRCPGGSAPDDARPDTRELAVPLIHGETVAAVLAVADKPVDYVDDETEYLRQLASMAADGIDALEARAAQRAAEARSRLAIEAVSDGVWDWDIANGRIAVNEAYLRMLGLNPKPPVVEMDRWRELAHPDDQERVLDEVEAALASGGVIQSEYRMRAADGTWRRILSRGRVAERDADGRPLRMVGIHTDVTELRRTQTDLETARARLEVALEGGDLGLYEVDLISGLADVDERYLSQLGLPPGDKITAERWQELLHPDDRKRLEKTTADVFAGRINRLDSEYRMRHAAGGWRWILDRWRVHARDENGKVLRAAGVHLDITERKEAEAALADLNRTLEERVAERTAEVRQQAAQLRALASELSRTERRERQRLARILHDHIQQLIVAAQMQLEWIAREADPQRLQSAAQGVRRALDEALEASRSLSVELSPPVLQEAGLIGGLNWLVSRMRDQHGFNVRFRADTSADPADEETRLMLFECARELLLNAVKHAGVGHAEVALTRPGDDEIRLIVSDRGSGFDPDVVKRRKPEETSFGLFSIQERLAHLGGVTDIESAPGRGTRVSLVVPVAEPAPAKPDPAGSAKHSHGLAIRRRPDACRVLIVDDHQIVREGLAGLLRFESDIEVVGTAADSARAIELTAELKPDVVIMDVNLGDGVDGVEATRRVRAIRPVVKVIGLSMHLDEDVARAMREAGAVDYLTKGGPSEGLIEAIRGCRAH